MIKILYLSGTSNPHDLRIVKALTEDFTVDTLLDFNSSRRIAKSYSETDYDFLVFSSLDLKIPWSEINYKFAYGLCMAVEINEVGPHSEEFAVIQSNIKNSTLVNVDNDYVQSEMNRKYEVSCNITNFKYGSDLSVFHGRAQKIQSPPRILCNRNWTAIHQNQLVLKALNALHQDGIAFHGYFLQPPDDQLETLREFDELLTSGKIEFMNFLSPTEMVRKLNSVDIYVSGTKSDGTSVSLLEAMACQKIVLVSNHPANLQVIKVGVNGFTFEKDKSEDIYEGLLNILGLRKRTIRKIQRNARRYVYRHGNWLNESLKMRNEIKNQFLASEAV
ncbi:glycosyltransferase [Candidatus Planktophila versatilis]|uniref:Glycosyltransferase n=2 Tax=Candidatus Planktophila versatilis TaxID=1884905 RepID=A0AAC9YUH7_9ACTN|nr:glycosyltransferase [Candidatus Planktophila versatilis]